MEWLSGKKTYILACAALVVIMAHMMGWVDTDTANAALVSLGFGTAITLRAAVAKGA